MEPAGTDNPVHGQPYARTTLKPAVEIILRTIGQSSHILHPLFFDSAMAGRSPTAL
jgi:hypothetical protein